MKDKDKYPTLVGDLINTLKTKNFTIQLTMGEVNDVKSYAPKYVETLLQVYEMFETEGVVGRVVRWIGLQIHRRWFESTTTLMINELLAEKRKIQKMNPSLLKSYALWDINRDIKNYDKTAECVSPMHPDKMCVIGYLMHY